MKRLLTCLLLLVSTLTLVRGQSDRLLVWEAGTFVSYKPSKSWDFNTSFTQRTSYLETNGEKNWQLSYLELNQFFSRKIGPSMKVAFGYKYRTTNPVDELEIFEHRITQQLTWTHLERRWRVVSRIRSEQRIYHDGFAQRLRYRTSVDVPLSGEKLDPGEFYLVLSNEVLLQVERGASNQWSDRIGGSLGFVFSESLRLEANYTHRLEGIAENFSDVSFVHTNLLIRL